MRRWYCLGLLVCACLVVGCSGAKKADAPTAKVKGTVEVDDKPLDDGEITFVGDPGTVPETLPVKAGAFEGSVTLGQKTVQIRAFKVEKAPKTATGGATEVKNNYIPEKFNSKSSIKAEVSESGVSPARFVARTN